MNYREVDCKCLDDLLDEIYDTLVDSSLKFMDALKVFPQTATEFSRRSGMIHTLHHLDLIDDEQRNDMVKYLKSEMETLNLLISRKKKVKYDK